MNDHDPVVIDDPIAHKFRNEFKVEPEMRELLARYWAKLSAAGETAVYRTPRHADPFFELFPCREGPRWPAISPAALTLFRPTVSRERAADIARDANGDLFIVPAGTAFQTENGLVSYATDVAVHLDPSSIPRIVPGSRVVRGRPPSLRRSNRPGTLWRFLNPALLRPSTPAPVVDTTALTAPSASSSWHRLKRRPRR